MDLTLFNNQFDSTHINNKLNINNKFIVSYIGTHGLSHALDKVLDSAKILLEKKDIMFLLITIEKKKMMKR